jgi:hypothetical protein
MKQRLMTLLLSVLIFAAPANAQSFSAEAGLSNFFGMPGIVVGAFLPTEPTGVSGGRVHAFLASDALNALGFFGGTGKTGWVFGVRSEVLIGQSLLPLIGVDSNVLGAYAKLGVLAMVGNISSAGGGLWALPVGVGLEIGAGLLVQFPNLIGAFLDIEAGYLLPVQWYAVLSFGLRLRIA